MITINQAEGGCLGESSCYFPKCDIAVRWYREDSYIPEADCNAGRIVRLSIEQELDRCNIKRANFQPKEMANLQIPQPLYAVPGHYPWLQYVDIRAFYYSIYCAVTWDIIYFTGTCLGQGRADLSSIWSHLASEKQARNAVIGTCRSTHLVKIRDGKTVREAYRNRLLNPRLYLLISDMSHALAEVAVNTKGCVYYNTDGGIFSNEKSANEFKKHVADLGFCSSVKGEGAGVVAGASRYQVGNLGKATLSNWQAYDNLRRGIPVLKSWAKHRRQG